MESATKKHLSITVYYLLFALLATVPCFAVLERILPLWRQGLTFHPLSLAVLHTLVLGFMLSVMYGVLYQFVPIAFQAPPLNRSIILWHLPTHVLAVCLMVLGFLKDNLHVVGIGGTVLGIDALLFGGMVFQSYHKARNKTVVHKMLVFPALSLLTVIVIGIVQALIPQSMSNTLILTHVVTGGIGLWAGLIFIMSYKLVPMFILSHGYKAALNRTAALFYFGLAIALAGRWISFTARGLNTLGFACDDIGAVLMAAGILHFAVDMIRILRARKRKRIVYPMRIVLFAQVWLLTGLAGFVAALVFRDVAWTVPAAYLFVFGGLIPMIFGYMQKIVPFLWFEYRFSKRPERKTAPLIDDMVPHRLAAGAMLLYWVGVCFGLVVVLVGSQTAMWESVCAWSSTVLTTAGTVCLFAALASVLRIGGPRPQDE